MNLRHPVVALAATAGWLLLTTGYGAAAAEPGVDLGGAPLPTGTGSTDSANPTALEPGLWTDTIGDSDGGSATHHFTYDRRIRFSTVHVGVVAAGSDLDGDSVQLEINTLGDEPTGCASATASYSYVLPTAVFGTRGWAGAAQPDTRDDDCLTAEKLEIVITRTTGDDELPIAIKVVEEAPASGAASLPEPEESPSFAAGAEPVGGSELSGRTAFDDAPDIPLSGGAAAFSTTITEGEQRLFRIPLTWGQQLSVEALLPQADAALAEERFLLPTVELSLVDPLRSASEDGLDGLTASGDYSGDGATRLSVGLPTLHYRNRYSSGYATVPGDHWLAIAVELSDPEAEPLEIPIDLEVEVVDTDGLEPTYEGTVQAPDGGAGPATYTPETPFLIGPSQFSAVASGTPVLPDAEDDGWWGPRRYAGLGLAVASLLCCGLGTRRLLSSRRT